MNLTEPSVLDSVFRFYDSLMLRLSSGVKESMSDFCRLETTADPYTFVTTGADDVSIIKVHGTLNMVGADELSAIHQTLELMLNGVLERSHYELQWVFPRLAENTKRVLTRAHEPALATARRLGLDSRLMKHIFAESEARLAEYVSDETCYLAITTRVRVMNKASAKKAYKRASAETTKAQIPYRLGKFAQPLLAGLDELKTTHRAIVKRILDTLRRPPVSMDVDLMDVHSFLREVREFIDPEGTGPDWKPRLPGDRISVSDRPLSPGKDQMDHVYYPLIAHQLFKRKPYEDGNVVRYGNRWFGTVVMDLTPQVPQGFAKLFRSIPKEINWAYSLTLLGDNGVRSVLAAKRTFGRFLRWSGDNATIKEAADALQQLMDVYNETVCRYRCAITVRARTKAQAEEDLNTCTRAMQGWGFADAQVEMGDPSEALVSTLPGLDTQRVGRRLISPIKEATRMCPIGRPVSPWRNGPQLFRTDDGRLYPMQIGSSIQEGVVDIFVAPPRSGKSVHLNDTTLAFALSPGLSRLPRIASLDIGDSGSGVIDLLQAALPTNQVYQAAGYKMRMSADFAINPFDTQLGVRYPTPSERGAAVNFLTLLFTPIGSEAPKPGIGELAGQLVDEAYKHCAEREPKQYHPHIDPKVDEATHGLREWRTDGEPVFWYDLMEKFMAAGDYRAASLAQRQAVPLLSDLGTVLNQSKLLNSLFKEEDLEFVRMMITSAIAEYPILQYPTQFDPSGARVVWLDLADVATSGGAANDKQGAMIYMLARHALARDYFFDEDDAAHFPEPARGYHIARLRKARGERKRLNYDEFHRAARFLAAREQVLRDIREGPKYGVQIGLSSHFLEDFGDEILKTATNVYVLGAPDDGVVQQLQKRYRLSEAAVYALRHEIKGVGADGASFLLWSRTRKGSFAQSLVKTVGPTRLWVHSSTGSDVVLRKALAGRVGYFEAVKRLAARFPKGTATDLLEEKQEKEPDMEIDQILAQIVEDLAGQ